MKKLHGSKSDLRRLAQGLRSMNGYLVSMLAMLYTGREKPEQIREKMVDDGATEVLKLFDFLVQCIERGEEGERDLLEAAKKEHLFDEWFQQYWQ